MQQRLDPLRGIHYQESDDFNSPLYHPPSPVERPLASDFAPPRSSIQTPPVANLPSPPSSPEMKDHAHLRWDPFRRTHHAESDSGDAQAASKAARKAEKAAKKAQKHHRQSHAKAFRAELKIAMGVKDLLEQRSRGGEGAQKEMIEIAEKLVAGVVVSGKAQARDEKKRRKGGQETQPSAVRGGGAGGDQAEMAFKALEERLEKKIEARLTGAMGGAGGLGGATTASLIGSQLLQAAEGRLGQVGEQVEKAYKDRKERAQLKREEKLRDAPIRRGTSPSASAASNPDASRRKMVTELEKAAAGIVIGGVTGLGVAAAANGLERKYMRNRRGTMPPASPDDFLPARATRGVHSDEPRRRRSDTKDQNDWDTKKSRKNSLAYDEPSESEELPSSSTWSPQYAVDLDARDPGSIPRVPNPTRGKVFLSQLTRTEHFLIQHAAAALLLREPEIMRAVGSFETMISILQKEQSPKGYSEKLFGVSLKVLMKYEATDSHHGVGPGTVKIPTFVDHCITALREMDMSVEGILRKTGNLHQIAEVINALDHAGGDDGYAVDLSGLDPVTLASLFKRFLRELPDPVLTSKLFNVLLAASRIKNPSARKRSMHLAICLMPKANRDVFEVVFLFLDWLSSYAHITVKIGNGMNLSNIATVMAPTLLRPTHRDPHPQEVPAMIRTVLLLLEDQHILHEVPLELAKFLRIPAPAAKDSHSLLQHFHTML
ncbi:RhoGAP-domain-containing protein [Meredithblackwellia eburnea MCA 4105]